MTIKHTLWTRVFGIKPSVAKEEIEVYKLLRKENDVCYRSPNGWKYVLNVVQPDVKIEINTHRGGAEVEDGYHSIASLEEAKVYDFEYGSARDVICKMVIPVGATYYKGTYAGATNYVSNTLILKGEI